MKEKLFRLKKLPEETFVYNKIQSCRFAEISEQSQ